MSSTSLSPHIPDMDLITYYAENKTSFFSRISPWTKALLLVFIILLVTVSRSLLLLVLLYLLILFLFLSAGLPAGKLLAWYALPLIFVLSLVGLLLWAEPGNPLLSWTIGGFVISLTDNGVLLVVTKGELSHVFGGGSLVGDLLVFLGAVSWVVYTMAGNHFSGWSPLRMTVLTCIPGTIGLIAINAFTIGMDYSALPTLAQIWSVKWQLAYFVVFTVVLGVWDMRRTGMLLPSTRRLNL